MTWNELKAHIEVMDPEQANTDATIQLLPVDEFFAVNAINFSPADDVLDKNHPYLEVNTEVSPERQNETSIRCK